MADVFAIFHIPSGTYMPETNRGRGYTSLDTSSFRELGAWTRLFHSRRAAENAMRCWLKGYWEPVRESDTDDYSGHTYSYTVGWMPSGSIPADRVAGHVKVVELRLEAKIR